MPLDVAQEAAATAMLPLAVTREGEGSGSRKSWSRRRKLPKATPALRRGSRGGTSTAAAMFGMTTRSRGREQQRSKPVARNKLELPSEGGRKRKRAKLDGISQQVSSDSTGRRSQDRLARKAKKRNRVKEEEEEEEEDHGSCSSAGSSPLREPYMPHGTEIRKPIDSVMFLDMQEDYYEKLARQTEIPTLIPDTTPNCLVNDPMLLHIREPSRKIVLRAAQFVVGISSSIDGEPLARCSGFWIDLDSEERTGTIVTTGDLIRTKRPSLDAWLCKDEYAPDAQVTVHLRGGTTAKGYLLYHQKHYNLAFFRVRIDPSIQLPSFSDEYDKGGPVIDLDGKVVGMIDSGPGGSFIPSSILLKCFHLWRNFERIRRPHLGLKFSAISLLNPVQVEKILIKYKIDEGLVVEEVSADSPAEKCGIRVGDVIERFNGKCISTALELENMLLSIVVNSGDGLSSDLDVEIQVYCTRRYLRRIKVLTVKVSEDGEFVARGQKKFATPTEHQEEGEEISS